jgi:type II secretory pathway pseudopilin PulG
MRSWPTSRRRSRKAFTLIELLLTTTLLVMLVTAVVVNVEGIIPEYRLEGAAREIGATAAEVQSTAALTGKIHGIVYDITAGEYWILAPPEMTEEEAAAEANGTESARERKSERELLVPLNPFRLHGSLSIKDISLGGKRTRTRGQVRVLFDADGTGPPHSVHLADRDGKEYTVEINPFAASVEYFEGRREFDAFLDEENR